LAIINGEQTLSEDILVDKKFSGTITMPIPKYIRNEANITDIISISFHIDGD